MKVPVHHFKTRWTYADGSKPPHWTIDGKKAWLGSGVLDKDGNEIYEGDRIRKDGLTGVVVFTNGEFFFAIDNLDGYGETLNEFPSNALEVIGHVED